MKQKLTITNFNKNSTFFIQTPKYIRFIDSDKSKKNLHPNESEFSKFIEEINKIEEIIGNNDLKKNDNSIEILDNYYQSLKNYFVPIANIKNDYASNILEIIKEFRRKEIKISLKHISVKYKEKFKQEISLMTISRVLRHKLNYHFLKTSIKNPIINNNNYKFMLAIFIKSIFRIIKLGLKLMFIDETGMQLLNNNFYDWRTKEEIITGGAKNDLKSRLNLILAIDKEKIIHNLLTYENIDTNKMKQFFKELIELLGEKKAEYVLIIDNAAYHLTDDVKKLLLDNKMKVLTNCPYYSSFNGIEYIFRALKSNLYKNLYKNKNELKNSVIEFLLSNKNKVTITKYI